MRRLPGSSRGFRGDKVRRTASRRAAASTPHVRPADMINVSDTHN
jgi:hypothetical protein